MRFACARRAPMPRTPGSTASPVGAPPTAAPSVRGAVFLTVCGVFPGKGAGPVGWLSVFGDSPELQGGHSVAERTLDGGSWGGGATWASHPFWARPPHLSAEGGPGRRGTPLLAKAPARGRLVRFPRRSVGVHSPHRDAQREAAALGGECGGLPSAITCLSSVRLSTESPVRSVGHPGVHRPPPRAAGGGVPRGGGAGPAQPSPLAPPPPRSSLSLGRPDLGGLKSRV